MPVPFGLALLLAGGEVHVLVRRHVVRQVQPAVAHQHRRPDDRVERDVVLADEVVRPGRRILPERPPGVRVATALRPLLARREIADDRVEPDVDALVVVPFDRAPARPTTMSRVIARSFSPSFSIPSVKFWTFRRQWACYRTHSFSRPSNADELQEEVLRRRAAPALPPSSCCVVQAGRSRPGSCRSCRTGRRVPPCSRSAGRCPRRSGPAGNRSASGSKSYSSVPGIEQVLLPAAAGRRPASPRSGSRVSVVV